MEDDDSDIILAISGGRDYHHPYEHFDKIIKQYIKEDLCGNIPKKIITGGARGVDNMAEIWAKKNNVSLKIWVPDYKGNSDNPKYAPLLRNTDIIHESTHLLALPTVKSRGTYDIIRKARLLNKPVKMVRV